ncbi:MAG: response regulator [Dehalococcoidia bacterium]
MTTGDAPHPTDREYLLIVDDEPLVRQALARGLFEVGYQCLLAANGQEALARLEQGRFAVMLCDIRMPGMDGFEVLRHARRRDPDMPVVMVTAIAALQTAIDAIRAGAYDYVTKPFTLDEVELTVRRALDYRRLRLENRRHVEHLEELVEERTLRINQIALGVVTSLGLALEAKDEWTHDHSRRVAEVAAALGLGLGMPAAQVADLRLAGMLHDIGKIGVREAVLHKSEELSAEEYLHIRLHPELGARILSPLRELNHVIPYIRHHHERWDGGGYPEGLRGEAIPAGARIIAVADAYVAMRERRPYRGALEVARAVEELRANARSQFDLDVVGAFLRLHAAGALAALEDGSVRARG